MKSWRKKIKHLNFIVRLKLPILISLIASFNITVMRGKWDLQKASSWLIKNVIENIGLLIDVIVGIWQFPPNQSWKGFAANKKVQEKLRVKEMRKRASKFAKLLWKFIVKLESVSWKKMFKLHLSYWFQNIMYE